VLLLFTNLLGDAAGKGSGPAPTPPPTSLPGGSQRRRGGIWEPSVAFAIAAAQEERRLWRIEHEPRKPKHPAARPERPAVAAAFERLEVVQLALRRAKHDELKRALRVLEEEEQAKLAALAREELEAATGVVRSIKAAREELEAAQAMLLIMAQGRREPIGDEEAAAILMNMLMTVKH
jgi:hypothetical protein